MEGHDGLIAEKMLDIAEQDSVAVGVQAVARVQDVVDKTAQHQQVVLWTKVKEEDERQELINETNCKKIKN